MTVEGDPLTPLALLSFIGVLGRLIRPGDILQKIIEMKKRVDVKQSADL